MTSGSNKFSDFPENQMTKFIQNFQILHRISICDFAIKTYVHQID